MESSVPSVLGSGAGLVGGALAAGGRGMPAPSGQIPPPWAWWENEAPATRAARGLVQAPILTACHVALAERDDMRTSLRSAYESNERGPIRSRRISTSFKSSRLLTLMLPVMCLVSRFMDA